MENPGLRPEIVTGGGGLEPDISYIIQTEYLYI